jgi:hypothetical protein
MVQMNSERPERHDPAAPYHAEADPLVDSAISHLDRLRRVLALEEWIRDAGDDPLLAASCRRWRSEREQLLAELSIETAD